MERSLPPTLRWLALACFTSLGSLHAQDIPTDVVGDTGWTFFGPDTVALVRAADGHAWMLHNLGADQTATASNDPASYGHYYQWGRWFDGHSLPSSPAVPATTLSPNNPVGLGLGNQNFYYGVNPDDWWSAGSGTDTWQGNVATATNGVDPCIGLGDGWQLPTQSDWEVLLLAEGITNTATAFSSNLKMPAAGHRDGQTATLINAGLYGQYWSSTASGAYARDLTVGDTWVNPVDDAYRSHGMSVRCLNKNLHVGVVSPADPETARLFPNPSSGTFTVDLGRSIIERMDVLGSDGRIIQTLAPRTTSATMDLGQVVDGVYAVRITTADRIIWKQVVVAR